jgi:hypothetical protein
VHTCPACRHTCSCGGDRGDVVCIVTNDACTHCPILCSHGVPTDEPCTECDDEDFPFFLPIDPAREARAAIEARITNGGW